MKVFEIVMLVATASLAMADVQPTTRPMQKPSVYLLIGQSNMAGRAPIPDDAAGPIERCLLLDDKERWVPARNPLNQYSTVRKELNMQKLGPGYSFAKRMLQENPRETLALVVNARGGTAIEEWAKGEKLYTEAVRRAKIGMQSGILKGILWHQGEGNSGDPDYARKLASFVADLRADLNTPDVPFVCGHILKGSLVNSQLTLAAQQIPNAACVSAEGLTSFDNLHFDTRSAITLGERYAEAMLRLQRPN